MILHIASTKSSSKPSKCPNCRALIKGVLHDARKLCDAALDEGRELSFKHGRIRYTLLLPSNAPEFHDEDLIRTTLSIPRGRARFLGVKGTKGYTVIGEHSARPATLAVDPGGAFGGGLLWNLARLLRPLRRPLELFRRGVEWGWGVLSLFFKTVLEPPPKPSED